MSTPSYMDTSKSADERARDLLSQLSLKDRVGLMFQTMAPLGDPHKVSKEMPFLPSMKDMIESGITHFNLHGSDDSPEVLADTYNAFQDVALSCNAKIPITLSSDPRHAFSNNLLASMRAGCFSQWPEQLGMVAIADEERMEEYGDIVRQEYIAIGLRAALHPQIDLATSYLWSRISGGMGEDADLASRLVAAYVKGLQGSSIGSTSVSGCVKHFPGGGPQRDGYDCHMKWGAEQDYPGENFDYHLIPFRGAVDAGVRWVMPSYGKPMGTKFEEVGMAYNKEILTGVLRQDLGFKGIVVSDWCILVGFVGSGDDALGDKAYGVEHLSLSERIVKALDAGVDQFGGETCVNDVMAVVREGLASEERIDKSAFLLLREKFLLGLFDEPKVDAVKSHKIVGKAEFVERGRQAQMDSLTLIKNDNSTLPMKKGIKVYQEGFRSFPEGFADLVTDPKEADVRIVRLETPWTAMGKGDFCRQFHHGSLEFDQSVLDRIKELSSFGPVIVDLYCDRPCVLGTINDDAAAIIVNYGVQESLLAKVLFGEESPKGKLPFELPRSMEAVQKKKIDVPFDSENPTYRFGHGLSY